MIKEIQGYIEKIEPKSGISSSGKPWNLWAITINGIKITTFNELLLKDVLDNQEVIAEYSEEDNGAFINRKLITLKDAKAELESREIVEQYTQQDVLIFKGKKYKLTLIEDNGF